MEEPTNEGHLVKDIDPRKITDTDLLRILEFKKRIQSRPGTELLTVTYIDELIGIYISKIDSINDIILYLEMHK